VRFGSTIAGIPCIVEDDWPRGINVFTRSGRPFPAHRITPPDERRLQEELLEEINEWLKQDQS
jgi:hypothetical protein